MMNNPSSDLLANMRRAHLAIERTIDKILAVIRTYPLAKGYLAELDDQVSAHIKRQDQIFFEELKGRFSGKRESLKLIEFLEVDTKAIKVYILEFFEKYLGNINPVDECNFPIDFKRFSDEISIRLIHEKDCLFPLLTDQAVDDVQ